jgi:hypothetical protein
MSFLRTSAIDRLVLKWKDYRAKGRTRYKTMTLATGESIRRFLLHVLPSGFHCIRYSGLYANAGRLNNLAGFVNCCATMHRKKRLRHLRIMLRFPGTVILNRCWN